MFAELWEKLEEFVLKETRKLHEQNGEENLQRLREGKVDSRTLVERWTQAYSMVCRDGEVWFWRLAFSVSSL